MPVICVIGLEFDDCPQCESDFDMLYEVLDAANTQIDETLEGYGFASQRAPQRSIIVDLPCGGVVHVRWVADIGTITHFNC